MTSKLGIGIIGCGDVVEKKSGPSIEKATRSRIASVMRRDRDKAATYAKSHEVEHWTDRAEEVVDHPEVDLVYVATPPDSHHKYVLMAARSGKHVVVEKPMGMNLQEAVDMVAICKEHQVQCFAAYYRRFHPHAKKMREVIESGRLGKVREAHYDFCIPVPYPPGQWRYNPDIAGGGCFVDMGSHRIDLMLFLLSGVLSSKSLAFDSFEDRTEKDVKFQALLDGDIAMTFRANFNGNENLDRMRIVGETSELRLENLDHTHFILKSESGEEERVQCDMPEGTHFGLFEHIETVLLDGADNRISIATVLDTEGLLDTGARAHIPPKP